MIKSHVEITVSGKTYQLLIRPESWSKVDIVDFSPRVVTGVPTRSELGLYIDTGQESFLHGYGEERYVQSQRYAYTGHLVDTSHGFASLYTEPINIATLSWTPQYPPRACVHRGLMFLGYYDNMLLVDGNNLRFLPITRVSDLISTGERMFIARASERGGASQRMFLADAGFVAAATSTTLTPKEFPYWSDNVFQDGWVYIMSGTGMGQIRTVSSNTSGELTISSPWTTTPDTTSTFIVYTNAGNISNPPLDFYRLALFGGYVWASELYAPYLHFWADKEGIAAEGGQENDAKAVRIGPGNYTINNLIPFNNQLMAMREDGVWAVGDDNLAYHILNFSDVAHANSFMGACVWNGFLFFTAGNTIYRYKSGLLDSSPPYWNKHWPFKMFGDYRVLVPRGKFLYAFGVSNATNPDEPTEARLFGVVLKTDDAVSWHKVADIYHSVSNIVNVPFAFYNPANSVLYWAANYVNNGHRLDVYALQLEPLGELPYKYFPTTGSHNLYLSYWDLNMIPIPKSFARVTLDGDFPSGTSVTVSYRIDDTTAFTTLGTINNSIRHLNFPTGTTGKRIQIRLGLNTTSSSVTPIVRAVILKCMARPDVKYGVTFDVLVEDDQASPFYGAMGMTANTIRQALEDARASVSPIAFRDIHGDSHLGYLSSLRFMLHDYVNENGEVVRTSTIARCTVVYV